MFDGAGLCDFVCLYELTVRGFALCVHIFFINISSYIYIYIYILRVLFFAWAWGFVSCDFRNPEIRFWLYGISLLEFRDFAFYVNYKWLCLPVGSVGWSLRHVGSGGGPSRTLFCAWGLLHRDPQRTEGWWRLPVHFPTWCVQYDRVCVARLWMGPITCTCRRVCGDTLGREGRFREFIAAGWVRAPC